MDFYAEKILTVAFDESGDIVIEQVGDKSKAVANHAKVQRDRLKVDALKWIASKLFPRRYGDKHEAAAEPSEALAVRWIITGVPRDDPAGESEKPADEPRQITYNPPQPPADLTPEAWGAIVRVSELIERIAGSDVVPEHVFGIIEGALRAHFVADVS